MAGPRDSVYVWVTWLTGVLAGDDHCVWQPWYKAHHTYDKRHDSTFDLAKWKADHGLLVRARAEEMRADGYAVKLEGQNKFTLAGRTCTLAGQPDILGTRVGADGVEFGRVVDCKTGTPKAKDIWQVCLYQLALPLAKKVPETMPLLGEVRYSDHVVPVPPLSDTQRARLLAVIAEVSASAEPLRIPSAAECRYCDIAACPDRVAETDTPVLVEAF